MASSKTKAPEQTLEESKYLKQLIDRGTRVRVKLSDNTELEGRVEFYDEGFLRITRDGEPNLFVYKHDIKYLYELP
jgi:host factor-I protein